MFLLGGQSLSTVYQRRGIRDLGYENMTFESAEFMNNTMYEYRFLRENHFLSEYLISSVFRLRLEIL